MSKLFLSICVFVFLILSNQQNILYVLTKDKIYSIAAKLYVILAVIACFAEIIMIIK